VSSFHCPELFSLSVCQGYHVKITALRNDLRQKVRRLKTPALVPNYMEAQYAIAAYESRVAGLTTSGKFYNNIYPLADCLVCPAKTGEDGFEVLGLCVRGIPIFCVGCFTIWLLCRCTMCYDRRSSDL
jgi:hypothetical protein